MITKSVSCQPPVNLSILSNPVAIPNKPSVDILLLISFNVSCICEDILSNVLIFTILILDKSFSIEAMMWCKLSLLFIPLSIFWAIAINLFFWYILFKASIQEVVLASKCPFWTIVDNV